MRFLIIISFPLLFFSFKADKSGPWIITKEQNLIVYARPLGYSNSSSPDSLIIRNILNEQLKSIDTIKKMLGVHFTAKVIIHIYNYDEAKKKIGTNGGGFAYASLLLGKHIFFAYNPTLYESSKYNVYLGKHEMTHVIAGAKLGKTRTRLMTEGYANAMDWTYGCKSIDLWINNYKEEHKMIQPSDLLYKNKEIPEAEFYTQSGFYIRWLIKRLGIEKTNKLYRVKKEDFIKEYLKITGEEFFQMEKEYMNYCYKN